MAYGTQTDAPAPIEYPRVSRHSETVQGDCSEGTISLRAGLGNEPASIRISLKAPEGMTFEGRRAAMTACVEYSAEWYRLANTFPGQSDEQGYFETIADGQRLIELARRTTELPSVETMLTQAGYRLAHSHEGNQFWKRTVDRHEFLIYLTATEVRLSFERYNARFCRNLFAMATHTIGFGDKAIPNTWPSFLQSHAMHVMMACQMTDDYVAAGRTASTRKSPKKKAA